MDFYNLDVMTTVDHRVTSLKATRFRQCTTKILNIFSRKGSLLAD